MKIKNSNHLKRMLALFLAMILTVSSIHLALGTNVQAVTVEDSASSILYVNNPADEIHSSFSEISETAGIAPAVLPEWTGTRIPAEYEPTFGTFLDIAGEVRRPQGTIVTGSPYGSRFNAVTGQIITSAPWDISDFSVFPEVEIQIPIVRGEGVNGFTGAPNGNDMSDPAFNGPISAHAHFRLNTSNMTAELSRLPQTSLIDTSPFVPNHFMVFEYGSSVTIPEVVTYNGQDFTVVSIGSLVVWDPMRAPWETIVLPDTITHIQDMAFRFSMARNFNWPSSLVYLGNRAFDSGGMGSIPGMLSHVGVPWTPYLPHAERPTTSHWNLATGSTIPIRFSNSTNLFPSGLLELGTAVFEGRTLYPWNDSAFDLPESLQVLKISHPTVGNQGQIAGADGLFHGGNHLGNNGGGGTANRHFNTVLTFPSEWRHIPPVVFSGMQLGSAVSGAQGGANRFQGIEFHDNITHIHSEAFRLRHSNSNQQETSLINSFRWPANLEYIGDHAFMNLILNSAAAVDAFVNFPQSIKVIGTNAFAAVRFPRTITPTSATIDIDLLTNLEVLGDGAFANSGRSFNTYSDTHIGDLVFVANPADWRGSFIGSSLIPNNMRGFEFSGTIPQHWTWVPPATFAHMDWTTNLNLDLSGNTNLRYIGNLAFALGGLGNLPTETNTITQMNNLPVYIRDNTGFESIVLPPNLEQIGRRAFFRHRNVEGNLVMPNSVEVIGMEAFAQSNFQGGTLQLNDGLWFIGAWAFENSNFDGTLYIPRSVTHFQRDPTQPATSVFQNLHRSWINSNFDRIEHHRFVRQMEGSLPNIDQRFDGTPVTQGWDDTYRISTADPILYKSARWTNETLTEAELLFQYGALIPWNTAFDLIFILDYSASMMDSVDAYYDGVNYVVPTWLVQNHLLSDAMEIFLTHQDYDNRVALTTFGGGGAAEPYYVGHRWNSSGGGPYFEAPPVGSDFDAGFTDNLNQLGELLRDNPLILPGNTNYGAGFTNAIEMINARTDDSRQPVIIVIGDGEPWPRLGGIGGVDGPIPGIDFDPDPNDSLQVEQATFNRYRAAVDHADYLREQGIPVFPLGAFLAHNELDGQNPTTVIL